MTFIQSFRLFAAASLFAATSPAATVPDPDTTGATTHELFLGFRAAGGQGGSTSYLIDLGSISGFAVTEGTSFNLSLGNIGLDLKATYGDAWFSRPDLYWGIFGTRTSASPTVYGSRERVSAGVRTDPWTALSLDARNSVDTQIAANVLTGIGGYRGSTATGNSIRATLQGNTANSSSYNFQVATEGTTDFGSLSEWGSIEGDFASSSSKVLDVWRNAGTGVTYRGAFSINNTGTIHYQYTTVPEPSVSLLLAAIGATAYGLRRRRTARRS